MLPRRPQPVPVNYTVARSQDRSIHVSKHGYVVYLIIRTVEGWRVYAQSSSRANSRQAHVSATAAARSYLKGAALQTIGRLGQEIDLEVLAETAPSRWLVHPVNDGTFQFVTERRDNLTEHLVLQWCRAELPRGTFRPLDIHGGIHVRDKAAATAFKLRWC